MTIILPANNVLRRRRPQLVLDPVLHGPHARPREGPSELTEDIVVPRNHARNVRPHDARVHRRHRQLRVLARQPPREQRVGQLALRVRPEREPTMPRRGRPQLVELDPPPGRVAHEGRADDDDVDVGHVPAVAVVPHRVQQHGHEQLGQQGVAQVVDSKGALVAVAGHEGRVLAVSRAGVEEQDVQTARRRQEGLGRLPDRVERGEVHLQDLDLGIGELPVQFQDRLVCAVDVPGRQPDLSGLVLCEFDDGLFS